MPRLLTCMLCCLLLGACGVVQLANKVEQAGQPPAGTVPPDASEALPAGPAESPATDPAATTSETSQAAQPAAEFMPSEASVSWLQQPVQAGTLVRLRLRDAALFAVLDPALRWELVALVPGAKPQVVPALLELPTGQAGWPLYTVSAAFAPSRNDAAAEHSYWPLLLPNQRLPLAKLKLVAGRPLGGTALSKAVDIVRLDGAGRVLRSLASGVVTPESVAGAGPNWFELAPESAPEMWAVEVHERMGAGADAPLLQLRKVEAYAAEVFIRAAVPENGELRLRVYPVGGAAPAAQNADPLQFAAPDTPVLAGELRELVAFTPEAPAAPAAALRLPGEPGQHGWMLALGLGTAGLLLLLCGLRLLRPLPERD